ncbi:hypothetical protein SAMN04488008_10282 [Maribacter orientalis]|uniref:Uncharacterized protein n=1 Tax=Maribacter orientalis TaxID=228957 RepID=A0A1H7JJX7_9FLAO|nr:hypothetical protein SAMN04488008_10282 [Maribacter orientalis]
MKNLQYARVGTVRTKANYRQSANNHQSTTGFVESIKSSEHNLINNTINNISCK